MIGIQIFNIQRALGNTPPAGPLPDSRSLFRETVALAWPSSVESSLIGLVSMVDSVMVSSLGTYALAAVGLTTQPKLIALAIFTALNTALSAIVARRKGEQDPVSAGRALSLAFTLTILLTLLVSTVATLFADPILRFAGSASDTHAAAVSYFRIIMLGFVFNTISMVINAAQRGIGNTKIAMRTNLVSNLINLCLNYLLIGGNLGFPRLGVEGAAIATVIGSIVACCMSVATLLHPDSFFSLQVLFPPAFRKEDLRTVVRIGGSTLVEQICLRVGFLLFAIVVARLGTTAFAAHQIGVNLLSLSFACGDGMGVAAVALVGRSLGEKRPDLAKLYGTACQRLGMCFSLVLSILFMSLGRPIFLLFSDDPEILATSLMIMSFLSIITYLQISYVIFAGCLRGAGDTLYVAFVGFISVTFLRPLFGWLLCYPLGLGLAGAWLGIVIDQAVRFSLSGLRFRSGKWMQMKI